MKEAGSRGVEVWKNEAGERGSVDAGTLVQCSRGHDGNTGIEIGGEMGNAPSIRQLRRRSFLRP